MLFFGKQSHMLRFSQMNEKETGTNSTGVFVGQIDEHDWFYKQEDHSIDRQGHRRDLFGLLTITIKSIVMAVISDV